ncbi:cell surface protein [Bacillus cereus]|uniref:S-layer homology domain-containing protein n=1 Tax=Bacillus cereus TaxID=1396 RepID=UPI000BFA5C96|nr:S-layer homology domain-containing protein [Bacillus cereus]PEV55314.1 cell surface protein [Bacillus cereus]
MANKFLKTATALTIMGTSLLGAGAFTAKAADNTDSLKFNDVPANHWSTKAIYDLTNRKVVQGYGNNIFGFGDNVTRGQVARMIYMYVKPADADASFKNPFTDIKGHLFEKEILALAKAGLVNGFGDGKYGPDDILTREQMAQVLTNAFKFKATKTTKFSDVDKNSWSYGAISALEENGVTIGTGGNMYSPKMFVTREAYSQFLYNSINAVEKETKPETNLPKNLDKVLTTDDVIYNPIAMDNPISQKSISTEAQNLIKSVNSKYGTNLKYADLNGTIRILDKNMYLPAGTIGAQVYIDANNENDFKIIFLDNNEATIELTKKWVTMLNSDLVLEKEIQESVDAQSINNYEKGDYKIRVGHSTAEHMMYVEVEPK